MDISTDSGRTRVIGADMAPGFILGLEATMAPGGTAVHPELYGPDGTNMASSVGPDTRHLHSL